MQLQTYFTTANNAKVEERIILLGDLEELLNIVAVELEQHSSSSIEESNTERFIENVSRHYAYGVTAAKVKKEKDGARKEALEKNKQSRR